MLIAVLLEKQSERLARRKSVDAGQLAHHRIEAQRLDVHEPLRTEHLRVDEETRELRRREGGARLMRTCRASLLGRRGRTSQSG